MWRDQLAELLRATVCALLVLLWLPVASHCALEAAGCIEDSHCCGKTHSSDEEASRGCGDIESRLLQPSKDESSLTAPLQAVAFDMAGRASESSACVAKMTAHCPDFAAPWLQSWSFERRAALPTQAP